MFCVRVCVCLQVFCNCISVKSHILVLLGRFMFISIGCYFSYFDHIFKSLIFVLALCIIVVICCVAPEIQN